MARKSEQFAAGLAQLARQLRRRIRTDIRRETDGEGLRDLHGAYCRAVGAERDVEAFADSYAQSLVCGMAAVRLAEEEIRDTCAAEWLVEAAQPVSREVLRDCLSLALPPQSGQLQRPGVRQVAELLRDWPSSFPPADLRAGDSDIDPIIHFYELFLKHYDAGRRARHGVFYTPRAVVRFVIRSVDELLCDEFGLQDGLADTATWGEMARRHRQLDLPAAALPEEPFVRVLDPAAGTGAFLVEVIDCAYGTVRSRWRAAGRQASEIRRLWNDYVPSHLLPRIGGLELMLPANIIAHVRIAAKLAETGYDFAGGGRLALFLADTLATPAAPTTPRRADLSAPAEHVRCRLPFTVIVGNPPFSAISNNRQQWIVDLLKGRAPGGAAAPSYYQADGEPLEERKLWLQDDYVKFIRFAQWRIESASCGLVGFVTNHGYLDNSTFRGMRRQLMHAFPRITVVDLHGNRKKRERAPSGRLDENVFSVEQGVAVGLLRRPAERLDSSVVLHGELWGGRREKQELLSAATASGRGCRAPQSPQAPNPCGASRSVRRGSQAVARKLLPLTPIQPQPPYYLFAPRDEAVRQEYERGLILTEIMPVHTTAPVTARDWLVVAFDEQELFERMSWFRDLKISHAEVRRRFFPNGRSANYPPGDTRGWRLPQARRRMAADRDWKRAVRSCLYRPFDHRKVYWTGWMIDWPRQEVMRHMLDGRNLALIVRRQTPPSQPCTYFWVCDDIALDGVIRSDNRGSESLFPLYLNADGPAAPSAAATHPGRRVNLAPEFVELLGSSLSLQWRADGKGDLRSSLGPEDVAHLFYAQFHSPTYRQRYADWLRADFPRVFIPASASLFRALCRLGAKLMAAHLLRSGEAAGPNETSSGSACAAAGSLVAPGYPKHALSRAYVNDAAYFDGVSSDAWDYHVGGYQVLRKWLKDRQGRTLTAAEAACYRQIVAAVTLTQSQMAKIDRVIKQHGGWPGAFLPR